MLWFGLLLFHVKLPITIGRALFFHKLCFSLLVLGSNVSRETVFKYWQSYVFPEISVFFPCPGSTGSRGTRAML
jgi:hypothetical protein